MKKSIIILAMILSCVRSLAPRLEKQMNPHELEGK